MWKALPCAARACDKQSFPPLSDRLAARRPLELKKKKISIMTPAISPENSWLNAIMSVKDSCIESSRDCKHPTAACLSGLTTLESRKAFARREPTEGGESFFSFSPPVSFKNCFLYPNNESTHTHKSNKLGGLITSLLSAFASLALSLSDNWQLFLGIWIACLNLEAVRVSIVLWEAWHPATATRFIEIKNVSGSSNSFLAVAVTFGGKCHLCFLLGRIT